MQEPKPKKLPLYLRLRDWWFYFYQDAKMAFLVFEAFRNISKKFPEKDIIQKIHMVSETLRINAVDAQIYIAINKSDQANDKC